MANDGEQLFFRGEAVIPDLGEYLVFQSYSEI